MRKQNLSHSVLPAIRRSWEEMRSQFPDVHQPIERHAEFCFSLIYRHPYPGVENMSSRHGSETDDDEEQVASAVATSSETAVGDSKTTKEEAIPRTMHGIAHVSRVALYVMAFYHLYRSQDLTISITQEDLKLLQIAALFHDSAREGDGIDYWDCESASLLYHYLMQLGVPEEKAIQFAEVIANKDMTSNYNKLVKDHDNVISWKNMPVQEKSIYMKLLHDADCLYFARSTTISNFLSRLLSKIFFRAKRCIRGINH